MNSTLENQQVEHLLTSAPDALTRNDVQPWIAMFAEDGVQEFPYAPAGVMPRTEGGRPGIAAHLGSFPENFRLFRISPLKFHHSADVTVAEFSVEGQAVKTGNAYNQQYISVIEHHGGQITRYVDYWNPLTALLALGGPEAFTAFSNTPS
ncbi:MAG: nuclear transport factor 2 family protein [Hymenobacter sp.]